MVFLRTLRSCCQGRQREAHWNQTDLRMSYKCWRRRRSPRTEKPFKTLFELFFTYLPMHTGHNVSFLVEERRGRNCKSHAQPVEVVGSCAKPNRKTNVMLIPKAGIWLLLFPSSNDAAINMTPRRAANH
jgi:hypothetical protein